MFWRNLIDSKLENIDWNTVLSIIHTFLFVFNINDNFNS
jgi:hypothetical protein